MYESWSISPSVRASVGMFFRGLCPGRVHRTKLFPAKGGGIPFLPVHGPCGHRVAIRMDELQANGESGADAASVVDIVVVAGTVGVDEGRIVLIVAGGAQPPPVQYRTQITPLRAVIPVEYFSRYSYVSDR